MKLGWIALALLFTIIGLAPSLTDAADQKKSASIPAISIHSMAIHVSNVERSLNWYQALFGVPVTARDEHSIILRIGDGPQRLAIVAAAGSAPGISKIGFGVKDLDADRALSILRKHDVASSANPGSLKALKPDRNAKFRNAAEVRFKDPAGITVALWDLSPETIEQTPVTTLRPAAPHGLLSLREYNHFTIFVPDANSNVQFYQRLFDLRIDTYQGPMPIIRVGNGNQFLAFVGDRSNAFVHHACFTVDDFDPDRIIGQLEKHGLKPRSANRGPAGPLEYYLTMRMPDRGGAPQGTPELYLTDPDGILLQIQDARYSGGGGYLGDKRGVPKKSD